jgi:hypothetical protein
LAQIGISSGLISEADGNAIKELLRKGPVSVALNWTDVLPKAKQVGSSSSGSRHKWHSSAAVPDMHAAAFRTVMCPGRPASKSKELMLAEVDC